VKNVVKKVNTSELIARQGELMDSSISHVDGSAMGVSSTVGKLGDNSALSN
jgi:hypothetical protein